jgi:hypothetical protein
MRTKQEKARELASKYGDVAVTLAVQLLPPWTAALPVAAAVLGFVLVGAGLPVLLGAVGGLLAFMILAARSERSSVGRSQGDEHPVGFAGGYGRGCAADSCDADTVTTVDATGVERHATDGRYCAGGVER